MHAQTVRYRMGQVRELYGDRLADPAVVRELVVALSAPRRANAEGGPPSPPQDWPVDLCE